jgi:hypothetical protein
MAQHPLDVIMYKTDSKVHWLHFPHHVAALAWASQLDVHYLHVSTVLGCCIDWLYFVAILSSLKVCYNHIPKMKDISVEQRIKFLA